jgi:hypothetical protein
MKAASNPQNSARIKGDFLAADLTLILRSPDCTGACGSKRVLWALLAIRPRKAGEYLRH